MAAFAGLALMQYYGKLMQILDSNRDLQKASRGIMKQVAWGAGGTLIGGVCGGPIGAMIGGLAGSVVGYAKSDNYKPLLTVIKNLSDGEKQDLVRKVQELVGSNSIEILMSYLLTSVGRQNLLNLLNEFTNNFKTN